MILQNIREQLRLWWELCERQKTAAEKIVLNGTAQLHDALVAIEAKVAILELNDARRIRSLLVAIEPKPDVTQIDAAIAVAEKAQADIEKAQEAATKQRPAAAVPAVPAVPAEGKHEVPASVEAPVVPVVPVVEEPKV